MSVVLRMFSSCQSFKRWTPRTAPLRNAHQKEPVAGEAVEVDERVGVFCGWLEVENL